jgi:hypothetical protein
LFDNKVFLLAYSILILGVKNPASVLVRSITEDPGKRNQTSEK